VQYAAKEFIVHNDSSYPFTELHPRMENIVFEALREERKQCFASLLYLNYGKITPEFVYRTLAGLHETGDTQTVVMELNTNVIYLANSDFVTGVPAYKRRFTKIDLTPFFRC
jgi:hypothetical protein